MYGTSGLKHSLISNVRIEIFRTIRKLSGVEFAVNKRDNDHLLWRHTQTINNSFNWQFFIIDNNDKDNKNIKIFHGRLGHTKKLDIPTQMSPVKFLASSS